MSVLNPVLDLMVNGQFNPSAPANSTADGWADWSDLGGPGLASAWTSGRILAANGSGGAISFPTFGGYTPVSYTAPSANAPAGNAAFTGWHPSNPGQTTMNFVINAVAGTTYTYSFWYAGNAAQSTLNWYVMGAVQDSLAWYGAYRQEFAIWTSWTPTLATGWQQYTGTWTAAVSGVVSFLIFGVGTDGTLANGSLSVAGGTVAAPVLFADLQFTTQSAGARAWPPGGVQVGKTQGSVAAGNDTRFPHVDGLGLIVPRTDRIELTWPSGDGYTAGSVSADVKYTTNGTTLFALAVAGVSTLSTSSGDHVTFDVTCSGVSILGGQFITISTTSMHSTVENLPLAFQVSGIFPLAIQIISSQGTIGDLLVTLFATIQVGAT